MRTFLRSILAFLTLGMVTIGCSRDAPAPPAQTDVVLTVPGMN
jgi:hypothetical protein